MYSNVANGLSFTGKENTREKAFDSNVITVILDNLIVAHGKDVAKRR